MDVDTATPYLVAQGLIDSAAIIDGELTITSVARRNRNLKVQGPAGKSYLIKQADGAALADDLTLQHEAAFYAFCQQHLADTEFPNILPRLVRFDPVVPRLTLELLGDAIPLYQYCQDPHRRRISARGRAGLGPRSGHGSRHFQGSAVCRGRPSQVVAVRCALDSTSPSTEPGLALQHQCRWVQRASNRPGPADLG